MAYPPVIGETWVSVCGCRQLSFQLRVWGGASGGLSCFVGGQCWGRLADYGAERGVEGRERSSHWALAVGFLGGRV